MKKFTFVVAYRGGTFISQYHAKDVFIAKLLWAEGLNSPYFEHTEREEILRQIEEGKYIPTPFSNAENVWFNRILLFGQNFYLTIVETV